ncbi:MAG: polyribonucleotide nucleotidyltransferase [Clostridiales bacterium]|jgi:polyribonucleotide nucleotidyltransferase|nr:polyribonucleotide nucleotidyltransferase [Clostridiales bacterium]
MTNKFTTTFAGRELTIETGKMAQLASGSCLVRYGDTVLLCNATMSDKPRDGIDFFPLSVDYEERLYSVGKIPGGFLKREGRPSEKAILTSRMIDRPMRPLFPKDLRNDVSLVSLVLSVEQDNSPEIAAMIGCSAATTISKIPFNGPIAGVSVGLVDGELVLNPTEVQRQNSDLALTVAGTKNKVVMIEAGANEVDDDKIIEAITLAHDEIKKMCEFIENIRAEIGVPKTSYESQEVPADMFADVAAFATDKIKIALDNADKETRDQAVNAVEREVKEHFAETYPDSESKLGECLYKLQKKVVRNWIFHDGKRVDGRDLNTIRELSADVGILPRVHGSGMFSRGQTQVLTIATLGALGDVQRLDGLDHEEEKRYMHHYNFPSYSVGETRPSRGPGRREIGHGALAERALEPVIPSEDEFPYAIRLVSEVLSSNGSTSQGSICGSTLALMDAGVPIKAPVAGISVGLVTEGDQFVTMLDIQGIEDFFGDMDFKVGGTKKGITAIQMDLKIDGLTPEIIREAIYKTRDARYGIIDGVMHDAIASPRADLSPYAPRVITTTIDVDKIRDVIGPGGKTIQKIIAETDVKIDILEDGRVLILSSDLEKGQKALDIVKSITDEPEVGKTYNATIVRIMNFGAFAEFAPGKEGLIHVSQLAKERVEKVEDVVKLGDSISVKLMEVDAQGRYNLSHKATL